MLLVIFLEYCRVKTIRQESSGTTR